MRLDFLRTVKALEGKAAEQAFVDQRDMFFRELTEGRMHAWVYESDGRILASCAFRVERTIPGRDAELLAVYTRPEVRRRGIASTLLSETIAGARAQGIPRLTLQATADSRRLYLATGFIESGDRMELALR
ncbi:MAG: GNAT family N-acetyltransferase [Rectinemataceae bacterium]